MINKQSGFSLLEIVIVIVIIGVIAGASAELLISGANAYLTSVNTINATWQGQIALERMVRDIRAIRTVGDITTATASALTFVDTGGTTNAYVLSGSTLTLNGNVLADGVNTLGFTYYDRSGTAGASIANIAYIKISLNITLNGVNYTVTTTANPRNLL